MMAVAYALDGLLFVPVMITRNLAVAVTFLALTNACVLFEVAQLIGWRMRVISEDLVGRVSGAARSTALAGTVPGALAGGGLADRLGAHFAILVAGYGYLVMALAVAAIPAVRRERRYVAVRMPRLQSALDTLRQMSERMTAVAVERAKVPSRRWQRVPVRKALQGNAQPDAGHAGNPRHLVPPFGTDRGAEPRA